MAYLGLLYEQQSEWSERARVYERQIDAASIDEKRIELLASMGQLQQELLDDVDAARETYNHLLELDPDNVRALSGLQQIAELTGDIGGLISLLNNELENACDDAAKCSIRLRLGRLEERGGDFLEALEQYRAALELDGDHRPVLDALEEQLGGPVEGVACEILYAYLKARESWEALAPILARMVEAADTDPRTQSDHLVELAHLYTQHLDDSSAGLDCLLTALPSASDLSLIRAETLDLGRTLGRCDDVLASFNELGVAGTNKHAVSADDIRAFSELQIDILEHDLNRVGEALDICILLLDEFGDEAKLLERASRLAKRCERWNELAMLLERTVALEEDIPKRVECLFELAAVYRSQLSDVEAACVVLRRILEDAPETAQAYETLETLLVELDDHEGRLDLLLDRLEAAEDPAQRHALYLQLAELASKALDRPLESIGYIRETCVDDTIAPEALSLLDEILRLAGQGIEHLDVREAVCELVLPILSLGSDHEAYIRFASVRLQDSDEPIERMELRLELAKRFEDSHQVSEELKALGLALTMDGGSETVVEQLFNRCVLLEAWGDLAAIIDQMLLPASNAVVVEPELRKVVLSRASRLFTEEAGNLEVAVSFLEAMHEDDAQDEDVLRRLIHLYEVSGDIDGETKMLQALLAVAEGEEFRARLVQLAGLYEDKLLQPERAIELYLTNLGVFEADEDKAFKALERLYSATQAWPELAGILVQRADLQERKEDGAALFLRAASIYEEAVDDVAAAVEMYERVLELSPGNELALRSLEHHYAEDGRSDELLEVLTTRLASAETDDTIVELQIRRVSLLMDDVAEVRGAFTALCQIIELRPQHEEALERLAQLAEDELVGPEVRALLHPRYRSAGRWRDICQFLQLDYDVAASEADRVVILRELARIQEEQLAEPEAAFESLAEAYGLTDGESGFDEDLERLGFITEAYEKLAQLWSETAPLAGEREGDLRMRLGALYEVHLDEPDLAIEQFNDVLELEPKNWGAFDALEQILSARQDFHGVVELLERRCAETSEEHEQVTLLHRIALVQLDGLDDVDGAIDAYRQIAVLEPENAEVLTEIEGLLEGQERWVELVDQLSERRLQSASVSEVADSELRRAEILLNRLGEGQQAVDIYKDLLMATDAELVAQAAGHLEAAFLDEAASISVGIELEQVVPVLEVRARELNDKRLLAKLLDYRHREMTADEDEGARLLQEIADLLGTLEGEGEASYNAFVELFRNRPSLETAVRMRRLAHELGNTAAFADLLVDSTRDTEAVDNLDLHLLLGRVLRDDLRDSEGALQVLRGVLDIEPTHVEALTDIRSIHKELNDWQPFVDVLLDLASGTTDSALMASRLTEAATLAESELDDPNSAIDIWSQIVGIAESPSAARDALERLLAEEGRYDELVTQLAERALDTADPAERVAIHLRMADLQLEQLNDLEGALDAFRYVLSSSEDSTPATDALEGVLQREAETLEPGLLAEVVGTLKDAYAARSDWEAWTTLLEHELAWTDDKWAQLDILSNLATNQEVEQEDRSAALGSWARAFALSPDNRDVRDEVERLAAETQAWAVLVEALEKACDALDDPDGQIELLYRLAEIYTAELPEGDEVLRALGRIIEIDDSQTKALDGLLEHLDETAERNTVVALAEKRAELSDDADLRVKLYKRCADLSLQEPASVETAAHYLNLVVEDEPSDVDALSQLAGLLEQLEQWSEVAARVSQMLELTDDGDAQRALQLRLVEINELHLGDADEAIAQLQLALQTDPQSSGLTGRLETLLRREKRWIELLQLLEDVRGDTGENSPTRLNELDCSIAHILVDELDEEEQGIERYAEVLVRAPDFADSLVALERVAEHGNCRLQAYGHLLQHYVGRDDAECVRVYGRQVELLDDINERHHALVAMADLQRTSLDEPSNAFDAYGEALKIRPDDEASLSAMTALAENGVGYARFVSVLEDVKSSQEPSTPPPLSVSRSLARVYGGALSEQGKAIASWSDVLEADEYDQEALLALDVLYTATDNWSALISVTERRLEHASELDMLDLSCRLGRLVEVVEGDIPRAVDLHRSVLWEDASHQASREELERLAGYPEHLREISETLCPIYLDQKEWRKFAVLTEMSLDLSDTSSDRADIWLRAADVRITHLEDVDNGFDNLVSALQEQPAHEEVRARLIALGTETDEWEKLCAGFAAVAGEHLDPELSILDHLQIAEWSSERLNDTEQALRHYRAVLDYEPDHEGALVALDGLLSARGDWSEVVQTKLALAEGLDEPAEKFSLLSNIGRIMAEELGDYQGAIGVFEECLELNEEDLDTWSRLETLYNAIEDWASLQSLLERRLDLVKADVESIGLFLQLADLALDQLDDLELARQSYERVLELDNGHVGATDALLGLYRQLEYWSELRDLLEERLGRLDGKDERQAALRELAELAESQLLDNALASDYLRTAFDSSPNAPALMEDLERLLSEQENWYDLLTLLQRHLDAQTDKESSYSLNLRERIGLLAAEQTFDHAIAVEHLQTVVEAQPDNLRALEALTQLYEQESDWDNVIKMLEQASNYVAGDDKCKALLRLGNLSRDQLADDAAGIAYFQDALAEFDSVEALDALLLYYGEAGENEHVKVLLQQKVDLASGDAELEARTKLGRLAHGEGQFDMVIELLASQSSVLNRDGLELLVDAYDQLDDIHGMEETLQLLAVRLDEARRYRDLLECNFRLATLAEKRGDVETAGRLYERCNTYDATHLPTLLRMGQLFVSMSNYDVALPPLQAALLQQAKLTDDERLKLFLALGAAREARGELNKARDMYSRVLSLDAAHPLANESLERLA